MIHLQFSMKRLHTFLSLVKPGESPSTMNPVNADPVFAFGSGSVRAKTKYLNMTSLCKIPVKFNKISQTYKYIEVVFTLALMKNTF